MANMRHSRSLDSLLLLPGSGHSDHDWVWDKPFVPEGDRERPVSNEVAVRVATGCVRRSESVASSAVRRASLAVC